MLADFATNALSIATGVFFAIMMSLLVVSAFSDYIFGLMANIRRAWRQHMHD